MSSHQKLPQRILRVFVATVALSACGQPTTPDASNARAGDAPAGGPPVLAVRPPRTGPPRLARRDELTPAERAWGVAATRPAGVTYQPDVVLLEEGPTAIRAVSDNGLEWTIDARAANSGGVAPGKILYATSRVVGRVLAVTRRGDELVTVLGPVQITEVIRDARIELTTPIDPGEMLEYQAPEYPGSVSQSATPLVPAGFEMGGLPGSGVRPLLVRVRQPALVTPQFGVKGFGINAVASLSQIGLGVAWKKNGLDFTGLGRMGLNAPTLSFRLEIVGAQLKVCELTLSGAAGVTMELTAAAARGVKNVADIVHVPADFSIPLIGEGVPGFAITLRQSFLLKTGFTAAANLSANGAYTVIGQIGVGYRDGKLGVTPPALAVETHLVDTLAGPSQAAAGLNFTHQMRVIVGFGAFGFVTGPYFSISNAVGLTRETDLNVWTNCRKSDVVMFLGAGVGYFMPRVVTEGINTVLRALNLGEIAAEGGVSLVDAYRLVEHHEAQPKSNACRPR